MSRIDRICELNYDYDSREKEWLQNCNICGDENWTVLTHKDRYGYSAQSCYCRSCGLIVVNPRLTAKEYTNFYIETYRPLVSAYHGRLINAETVKIEQKIYANQMSELLAPFINNYDRSLTFLDVGGSTGVVASHLAKTFNLKTTLIDPAPAEVDEARQLGIETITGFIEDWDSKGRNFDIIGMFQTIDHLLNAKDTFMKMRELIASDGLFVVDIVDVLFVARKNKNIEQAIKIDHPFNFTESTAELLLQITGFKIVHRAISEDKVHITYICKPVAPNLNVTPNTLLAEDVYQEIRKIQSGKEN